MDSNTMRCQEWPSLCCSNLGSEHSSWLCWQVGRVQSRACVCHVTFSSSVNVVDYFLRDQNWLPRTRPPSIFSCACRTQRGLCGAEAHGKGEPAPLPEQVTKQWSNSLLNLHLGGDCADMSRTYSEKSKYVQSWNFISAVTFFLVCTVSSLLQMADEPISQTLLDASAGWRITSTPRSTWPSLPLLCKTHRPLSVSLSTWSAW